MRLSLAINGAHRVTASVSGPGYLNVHLNMRDRPKDNDYAKRVRIDGTQTLETESVRLNWPAFDLQTGDILEFRLLEEGEGDAPSGIKKSTESPSNLFSSIDLAKELLQLVSDFDARLMELVEKSEKSEPADEHKKFCDAVGMVSYIEGEKFLYPIYRRHKELIPENLKGELL